MKKLLGILVLELLIGINPLIIKMRKICLITFIGLLTTSTVNSGEITQNGKVYSTGTLSFGADPYVIGCIYDTLDASFGSKCAQRSLKWYFNEGKYPGSLNEAYEKCRNDLYRRGINKYVNFARGLSEGDYTIECSG